MIVSHETNSSISTQIKQIVRPQEPNEIVNHLLVIFNFFPVLKASNPGAVSGGKFSISSGQKKNTKTLFFKLLFIPSTCRLNIVAQKSVLAYAA